MSAFNKRILVQSNRNTYAVITGDEKYYINFRTYNTGYEKHIYSYNPTFFNSIEDLITIYDLYIKKKIKWGIESIKRYQNMYDNYKYEIIKEFSDETFKYDLIEYLI